MKKKIVEVLVEKLQSVYCYNCFYEGSQERCADCHRKSMNWGLSKEGAEELADLILEDK